jgi:hypothetical protein
LNSLQLIDKTATLGDVKGGSLIFVTKYAARRTQILPPDKIRSPCGLSLKRSRCGRSYSRYSFPLDLEKQFYGLLQSIFAGKTRGN